MERDPMSASARLLIEVDPHFRQLMKFLAMAGLNMHDVGFKVAVVQQVDAWPKT
jgi:hypothetical protein